MCHLDKRIHVHLQRFTVGPIAFRCIHFRRSQLFQLKAPERGEKRGAAGRCIGTDYTPLKSLSFEIK